MCNTGITYVSIACTYVDSSWLHGAEGKGRGNNECDNSPKTTKINHGGILP